MQISWTDLADVDLEKIAAYIARENSPGVAIDVVLNVIDSTQLVLAEHPLAGRPGRLKGTRELVIGGLPFIVIYRQDGSLNQLQVLRVLHAAQRWPTAAE